MSFDLLIAADGQAMLFCNADAFATLQGISPAAGDQPPQLDLRLPGGRSHRVALPADAAAALSDHQSLVAVVVDEAGAVTKAQRLSVGDRLRARPQILDPAEVAEQLVALLAQRYTVSLIR